MLKTVKVPYYLVVVDNCSSDGSQEWLIDQHEMGTIDHLILNPQNDYPGKACNRGWKEGLEKYPIATHLMRCDNDFDFYEGWSDIEKYFEAFPKLGLLGLDWSLIEQVPEDDEFAWLPWGQNGPAIRGPVKFKSKGLYLQFWPGFVGGLAIMKREAYDKGIRYSERKWYSSGQDYVAPQDDAMLSIEVMKQGYELGHVTEKLARTFGDMPHWKEDPQYYLKSLKKRGYERMFPDAIRELENL